jgi:hypothetical protein
MTLMQMKARLVALEEATGVARGEEISLEPFVSFLNCFSEAERALLGSGKTLPNLAGRFEEACQHAGIRPYSTPEEFAEAVRAAHERAREFTSALIGRSGPGTRRPLA